MDIRLYFETLAQVKATLPEGTVVIVSEATPEGGKAGVVSEVNRDTAAQLIAERKARKADAGEEKEFHLATERARASAEERRLSERVHVTLVPESDYRAMKGSRPSKG